MTGSEKRSVGGTWKRRASARESSLKGWQETTGQRAQTKSLRLALPLGALHLLHAKSSCFLNAANVRRRQRSDVESLHGICILACTSAHVVHYILYKMETGEATTGELSTEGEVEVNTATEN